MPDSLGNHSAYGRGPLDQYSSLADTLYSGVRNTSSPKVGGPRVQDHMTQVRHSAGTSPNSQPSHKASSKVSPNRRVTDSPFLSNPHVRATSEVSINIADQATQENVSHQTSNFANLAAYQGIRDWNSKVFDDRWLLRPEEVPGFGDRNEEKSTPTKSLDRKLSQQR